MREILLHWACPTTVLSLYFISPLVPCTWRTADLNKNIKEMEAKINNQKNYIKLQEETIKRNDE